jgi:Ca2+-binding RTX toxin-like protein
MRFRDYVSLSLFTWSPILLSVLIFVLSLSLMAAGPFQLISYVQAGNDHGDSNIGDSNLNKLGSKIEGLELPPGCVFNGNVITCAALVPCVGTNDDDIMFCGIKSRAFALDGDDLVYGGGLGDQVFGGKGDDLLIAGAGKSLLDGGSNDDVLMGGLGNNLLAGGNGNDKLFNGAGTAVMYGGKGANHFDCSLSALGLARSVVMDYNPSNGDTISGPCKIVNTIGNNGDSTITLPDTGETTSTEVIPGTQIGSQ